MHHVNGKNVADARFWIGEVVEWAAFSVKLVGGHTGFDSLTLLVSINMVIW